MLATSAAARSLLSRTATRATRTNFGATSSLLSSSTLPSSNNNQQRAASTEPYADYGKSVFSGRVADEYLKKHGSSVDILNDPSWVTTHSDTVANAVLDW